jgi:hypothetical protein
MNFKTTITLLVLLAVVVGASWFLGVFSPEGQEGDNQPAPIVQAEEILLIAPMLEDVDKVRLEVSGRGHMVFVSDGPNWNIVEPVDAAALPWEVTDLIGAFTQARKLETIQPGRGEYATMTLADFGLESPLYTVSFEGAGRKLTFLVGKNVVASENTYVKTPDSDEVYIIDQNMKTRIKKDLAGYRDTQFWDLKKNNVTELVYAGPNGEVFRFTKDDAGRWTMLSPILGRADKNIIANAVGAISTLKAQEFTEDHPTDLSRFGLEKPVWKVTVVETEKVKPTTQTSQPAPNRTEHHLLVGRPAGLDSAQVYAKLADKKWVVTIAQDSMKKIIPDVMTWRDKSVVPVNKNDITRVDIRRSAQDVMLVRENDVWKLKDGAEFISTDDKIVSALLNSLASLKAASFIDQPDKKLLTQSKLSDPACTITIYTDEKAEPLTLALGETTPSGMFRYVRRANQDTIAAVAVEQLTPIFTPALSYRDKQMMAFSMDTVKSIELVQNNRRYTLARPTPTTAWQVTSPISARADQDSVKNIIMVLATLKAQDFVARGYLANYDLDHPQIKATINIEVEAPVVNIGSAASQPATQTKPTTRLITRQFDLAVSKHNDRYYAVRLGQEKPLVAMVTSQVYNDLNAELIDRAAFGDNSPQKDAIDRIVINPPDARPMEFKKTGGAWTFPADPVVQIDQEKVEQVLRTFSRLKAKRYAEFEPSEKSFGLKKPFLTVTAFAGSDMWTVSVGEDVNGRSNRYAQTNARPWIFEMKNSDVEKLNVSLKDLVKAHSAAVPASPAY